MENSIPASIQAQRVSQSYAMPREEGMGVLQRRIYAGIGTEWQRQRIAICKQLRRQSGSLLGRWWVEKCMRAEMYTQSNTDKGLGSTSVSFHSPSG